jgi:hypothetical protein
LGDLADEQFCERSFAARSHRRAARQLPPPHRARYSGMSTEEASAVLRVKDQTLKSRLHRGRLILRKQLADFAGGLTLHKPCYGCERHCVIERHAFHGIQQRYDHFHDPISPESNRERGRAATPARSSGATAGDRASRPSDSTSTTLHAAAASV